MTKRFGGQIALDDASLRVQTGSIHAIAGENGAGKSTLIKILAGVYQPDAGQVRVGGRFVAHSDPRTARSLGLGFLHQDLNIVPSITVRENMFLTTEYPTVAGAKIDWGDVDARCRVALKAAGLDIDLKQILRELSPAHQQLVALARVLIERPRILVLDEPTTTLGASDAAHLLDVLRGQREEGATVILVSHRLDDILDVADEVTVLRDGEVVASVERAALGRSTLVELLGGAPRDAEKKRMAEAEENRAEEFQSTAQRPLLEVSDLAGPGLDHAVNLTIRSGEVVGLAGLVGSGRSTLATMLSGGGRITGGTIHLAGRSVNLRSRQDAISRGIVHLPSNRAAGLVPEFDVAQNLTLGHVSRYAWRGLVVSRKAERRAARSYISQLDIKVAGDDQVVRDLSGGNQQKVLIARALDLEPRVLLLDEPTAGIDLATKEYIYNLVRSLADDGLGILFISSELDELPLVADRTLIFSRGLVTHELSGSADRAEIVSHLFAEDTPIVT